jgi:predicted Zn-dependent protease
MAARLLLLACALLAGNAPIGCVQDDGSRFNPIEAVVPKIDEDDERELGLEFDRELQKHVTVIHDPLVSGFLNDLGQSIVSGIEPQPFVYRFRVIEDPNLNAFAVPGGYIYFHSGTLLAAASVDELAGVMGHEIAHVKARHFARMQAKSQLPDLLAGVAGMAAAVVTEEPGLLVAAQAANVAMKLRFSREFETEADQLGGVFMTRAGYDPAGITRFFERLLDEKQRMPDNIPPYLFSHPDVEDRILAVAAAADSLSPTRVPEPALQPALRHAQARLAALIDAGLTRLPSSAPPPDRSVTDPLLAEADALGEAGELDAALGVLARAEAAEPNDPRVPFRIGDLLYEAGRYEEAIGAYRRTARLDTARALVFYRLGLAHARNGERHRAVFAFEQSILRAGAGSNLRERAEWEVSKLTFGVIRESGLADGRMGPDADTPVGASRERFPRGSPRLAWWARLGPRFVPYADRMKVRWIDPAGRVLQDAAADRLRKPYVASILELADTAAPGDWNVEVRLQEDLIERRSVPVD